jgi:hypothetical protein
VVSCSAAVDSVIFDVMTAVVPHRFLFRWSFPVPYWPEPPKANGPLPNLPASHQLPSLCEFDGTDEFAVWKLGWNEQGLVLTVDVAGKLQPVRCDPFSPASSSGVHMWIDTRCTQNVHRATRFCHRFSLLPTSQGKKPLAVAAPLGVSREQSPASRDVPIRVASELRDDGYGMKAWIPAESLTGYDPEAHPRLGFYGVVLDAERGAQRLTVGSEFPYESDPSLWQTLELVRE